MITLTDAGGDRVAFNVSDIVIREMRSSSECWISSKGDIDTTHGIRVKETFDEVMAWVKYEERSI